MNVDDPSERNKSLTSKCRPLKIEPRSLQVFYLDLGGAQDVTCRGPYGKKAIDYQHGVLQGFRDLTRAVQDLHGHQVAHGEK